MESFCVQSLLVMSKEVVRTISFEKEKHDRKRDDDDDDNNRKRHQTLFFLFFFVYLPM